MNKYLLGHHH